MPVRHVNIIGQRRPGQGRANAAHVDYVMGNLQTLGAKGRIIQFLAVTLSVIKGHKAGELLFLGNHMRK